MKKSTTKSRTGTAAILGIPPGGTAARNFAARGFAARGFAARGFAARGFVLGVVTVGVFTFGLTFGGVASPARGHTELVSSTPASDTTITELPELFSVTTSEPLLDLAQDASGFGLQVIDAAGKYFGDGCLVVSESTLSMGSSLGDQGDYRFVWQVVAEDGHPVSGEFTFTWDPDPGTELFAGSDEPPVCDDGELLPSPNPTPTADPTSDPTDAEAESEAVNTNETAADSAPILLLIGVGAVLIGAGAALTIWLIRRRP